MKKKAIKKNCTKNEIPIIKEGKCERKNCGDERGITRGH